MATTLKTRTPAHLWIVGALALLWNCFGAFDYLMTRTHNMEYIAKSMPGTDPNTVLAWVEGMPMFAQFGWGLGVWAGVLGAVLMLVRSRFAVWSFAMWYCARPTYCEASISSRDRSAATSWRTSAKRDSSAWCFRSRTRARLMRIETEPGRSFSAIS